MKDKDCTSEALQIAKKKSMMTKAADMVKATKPAPIKKKV